MTSLLVTADTNILVSGIARLRTRPDAAPAQFVRSWQAGQSLLVYSAPLLAEIDRTLANPYFAQRVGSEEQRGLHDLLIRRARRTPLTVPVIGVATHPEDDLVLATALSGNAQFVVTGDYKLVSLKQYQGLVLVTVREFLATLPGLLRQQEG